MKRRFGTMRFICKILIATMLFTAECVPSFSAKSDESSEASSDTAVAVLGKTPKITGFSKVILGTVETPRSVTRDGYECWQINKNDTSVRSIKLSLSEEFKASEFDGTEYVVEVDYYDTGRSYMRLLYDDRVYHNNDAGFVYVVGEDMWKTATFVLQDADFKNRLSGEFDMEFTSYCAASMNRYASEPISIKEIRVKKRSKAHPLYFTTDTKRWGNAFEWYSDKKILYDKIENFTGSDITAEVNRKIVSDDGVVAFEKSERLTMKSGEIKEQEIDFSEVKRCDNYSYVVTVKSDDGSINSERTLTVLSVLKTDPNGIQNDDMYYCSHIERGLQNRSYIADLDEAIERFNGGVEVMKMSNASGFRETFGWGNVERSGEFNIKPGYYDHMFEALRKNGMHFIPIMDAGHGGYTGNWSIVAHEPKHIERAVEYAEYVAKELGDVIDVYEIFNEPNLSSFNAKINDYADGAYMAMIADKLAEGIHKYDSNARVYGLSVCSMMMDSSKKFFRQAVDSGLLANHLDGFSYHPYINIQIDDYDSYNTFMKYYTDILDNEVSADYRLLSSEVGYTCPDEAVQTEERKGAMNVQTYIYYKVRGLADIQCFYNYEQGGKTDVEREDRFGMVTGIRDEEKSYGTWFLPQKSYLMMTAMNYVLAKSEPLGLYDSDDGAVRMSKFKSSKFGKNILTLYANKENRTVTLDLGADKVTCYDYLGNEQEVYGKDGIFTFKAGFNPIYIVGDIEKQDILENNRLIDFDSSDKSVAIHDFTVLSVKNYCDEEINVSVDNLPGTANVEKIYRDNNDASVIYIVVRNEAEVGTEYRPVIKISDGEGRVMASYEISLLSSDSIKSDFSVRLEDKSNLNRWIADIKIKNLSQTNAAKATVKILYPSDVALEADAGIITKGREGEISVLLPNVKKKGRQRVQYEVLLNNGETYSFSQQYETTLAPYAHKKPTIDGVIEKGEWNMNAAMYADSADHVIWNPTTRTQYPYWSGPDELSGRSVIEWDEENLYLMAEVTDDIFYQPNPGATSYNGDNMQFGISYNDNGYVALGQSGTTFHEFGLSLSPEGPAVYRTMSQDNVYEKGYCDDAVLAVKRSGTKTIYELCMPWKSILKPGQGVFEDAEMLYSFLFNDNDGSGRMGWIECGSGIGLSKNISLFMKLKLIK